MPSSRVCSQSGGGIIKGCIKNEACGPSFLLVPTSGGSIPDRGPHGGHMQGMYAAVYCQTCENCDTCKGCMLQYTGKRVKTVKTVENRS